MNSKTEKYKILVYDILKKIIGELHSSFGAYPLRKDYRNLMDSCFLIADGAISRLLIG